MITLSGYQKKMTTSVLCTPYVHLSGPYSGNFRASKKKSASGKPGMKINYGV